MLAARQPAAVRPVAALAVRIALIVGIVLGTVRFGALWRSEPPGLAQIRRVDLEVGRHVRSSIAAAFPGVIENNQSVAVLSWTASAVYLYWSPLAPPVDWVAPPSSRASSDTEFKLMADFIDDNAVPFLIVQEEALQEFRGAETPLRRSIAPYVRVGTTPFGVALVRR